MTDNKSPQILGTAPIGKLLIQYSIPAIIAMTVSSLYHIIDSIFIGQGVGATAIAGLAVTFPLMNLVIAFCNLVGIGGATISSIFLGQRDTVRATETLHNVVWLCLISSICFGGISLLFLDPILLFFGASESTLPYGREFMQVILIGTPIAYLFIGLNNVMRSTGYPSKAMYSSIISVIANIIIAPIFIFIFKWGIRGAALATLLSQVVGLIWVLRHFYNTSNFVHFDNRHNRLKASIVSRIFSIGLSPFLMNACSCLVVIIINRSCIKYGGDMAVGAYGITNRVLMLFAMTAMGITQGMQPIIGYNYGARKIARMHRTLVYGIIAGTIVTSLGFIMSRLIPEQVVRLFTSDTTLIDLATNGLRITCTAFCLIGGQIVISNFFQSIGKAKVSIFLSLSRQLIFLIPALLILPGIYGIDGVWASAPLSDVLAFFVAAASLWIYLRNAKKQSKSTQEVI
ncbi:MAG: MATE family efflux transporter [Bacteroidaceae bacterium]|nr:MATE family efflux transporter [Bacteroidaceae bacterium]